MADLSLFDLTGKKAVVTGAAMGIGRGYALALAKAGADIAVVDLHETAGESVAQEVAALGSEAHFVQCDVTSGAQVKSMIEQVMDAFGKIDIGVNNAGIVRSGTDEEMAKQDWDAVIAVNLTGVFLCAQAEAQQMISQAPMGGKIVNTASMSATIANANASYNASKAGVAHMTRTFAVEWGKYNINVNCISPSYLLSPMHGGTPEVIRDRMRERHPVGWLQRPEDLYGPIVFLCSQASDYVTGHDLIVDGGHTLNAWLAPIKRVAPPRVTPEEEVVQLKHDLDVLGIEYDSWGIAPSLLAERRKIWEERLGIQIP